jgi:DNA-binding response OmpR family regulator
VVPAATGAGALAAASAAPPDVVILDLGLPDLDGVAVIEGLRGWCTAPIIVLSARHEERAKVCALDAGADDYVTKPFGMEELLARLRAAVRRTIPVAHAAKVETATFTIDLAARRVMAGQKEIRLAPAGNAGPQRRQARHSASAAATGVGTCLWHRDQLPSRTYGQSPPQAGTRSFSTALSDHRT